MFKKKFKKKKKHGAHNKMVNKICIVLSGSMVYSNNYTYA